jgi:hypothetical protein
VITYKENKLLAKCHNATILRQLLAVSRLEQQNVVTNVQSHPRQNHHT